MRNERSKIRMEYLPLGALVLAAALWAPAAGAQDGHGHGHGPAMAAPPQPVTAEHRERVNALVRIVRESTRRFQDISVALAAGYVPQFGCVSGDHEGAMGVHLVNGALVGDPALDAAHPEILVYEPKPNGRFELVAADYLVIAEAWHANNPAPPELVGQLFHLFPSPNRFGLPAFYTLHVWAWKDNPQGTFANWNPRVSCDDFRENPRP
jgi:hypothetical protein